ncbi:ATP-NAD kinase-like domain-containing protein [Radiomyces spectabilis]|uniref:ATP-NAD kinase-like domain-containing protein n=1 Tax=Radiomyces spectabilis TaxID=64574 RepID=UPI00221F2009|nr:ATP-NAD kinase-like domain-containing protein [Radiomyces spectabilis]KAI8384280.1 ATP-NAD kinase-like domain-containing protein [Radiomyces spectabilis]
MLLLRQCARQSAIARRPCWPWHISHSYNTSTMRKTTQLADKLPVKLNRQQDSFEPNAIKADVQPIDLIQTGKDSDIVQVPGSTYGGQFTLNWAERPRNILIVKKPNDVKTEKALVDIASWLHQKHPVNIIVESEVAEQFHQELPFAYVIPKGQKQEYTRTVDFAITLGGDGTMLHLSSLFPKAAPPVICFSLGTLGFLMTYDYKNYKLLLDDMMACKVSVMLRMRLFCSLHQPDGRRITVDGKEVGDRQVMNEVSLHRGRYPHLTTIDCLIDNQYLTECVADGLIVSTPTGSTAYSLSAGGPIVHPSVQSLVLTPICPRSLSFRTVLLPPSANVQLKIGQASRSEIEVSMDGQEIFMLDRGEYLQVRMSKYPIPCVSQVNGGTSWAKDINELLKWNQNFGRNLV